MALSIDKKLFTPVTYAVSLLFCVFQIYTTAGIGSVETEVMRCVHLALVMFLIFLSKPLVRGFQGAEPAPVVLLDILLAVLSLAAGAYIYLNLDYVLERAMFIDDLNNLDIFFGTVVMVLTLEVTRRTVGWPLVIVALVCIGYALFGQHLPSSLGHRGVEYQRLVEHLYLLTNGIYGIPLGNACTIIFAFIMFGAFLGGTGMSTLFMDLACFLTRKAKGGPAKAAVLSSAFFGTISGSAVANVYGTGTFTIPLMKKAGYRAEFAGAVEAVASTGGQITPPIMGAAAFIMADLSGLGYIAVLKAAVLPALLYYLALFFMVHFEACSKNLTGIPANLIPTARVLLMRSYRLLPIVILIVALFNGRSVMSSAYLATISVIIIGLFSKETRLTPKRFADALIQTARGTLIISSCCACAGIVVGVITITGAGFSFINSITTLADGNLLLLMLCLMVTCIVLGMGVPTAPAYIIAATLGVPALLKVGVLPVAAHMFALYFAIVSTITPPVCMASFAGASIAEAKPMGTAWMAVKLGIAAFIIPYMFVYEPALLLNAPVSTILIAVPTAILGIWALAGGLHGWHLTSLYSWERLLLGFGGLTLVYPGLLTDITGFCLVALACTTQHLRTRKAATAAAC